MSGFIEIVISRRRRGRPSRRRVLRVVLRNGIALEIGDGVPGETIERIIAAVLPERRPC